MKFELKHYDNILLKFEYVDKGLEGQFCKIYYENQELKHLLPLGFVATDEGVFSWLKRRIIPKNREFVEQLISKMGLAPHDTIGIIKICKGLSVNDSYWVVEEGFQGKFADYNLYENDFSSTLSLVAYTGYGSVKAQGFTSSPEFTTNGMLKKAWRKQKGEIVLFKGGTSGAANTGKEPYSEYYAAQIAETMNINHVEYGLAQWKNGLCSTCKLFTDINTSYVPIYNFVGSKPFKEVADFIADLGDEIYEDFVDMVVFDALVCNTDRHYGNFGMLVNSQTNEIIGFAPLFDHGLALFNFLMDNELEQLEEYANTRVSCYNIPFVDVAKEFITNSQKEKLHNMVNFKFSRHKRYNLPAKRLRAIEKFLQTRMTELLELKNK